MFDLSQAIADLKANWPNLLDVDRAEAITPILEHGKSGRGLAAELECPESLLRHIQPLARATPTEKQQSRAGQISTNKLSRAIVQREQAVKAQLLTEAHVGESAKTPAEGCVEILSFVQNWVAPSYARPVAIRIVEQAGYLDQALRDANRIPQLQVPSHWSAEQTASHLRHVSAPSQDDSFADMNSHAAWLVRFVVARIPDSEVRAKAYDVALQRLKKPTA